MAYAHAYLWFAVCDVAAFCQQPAGRGNDLHMRKAMGKTSNPYSDVTPKSCIEENMIDWW